MGPSLFRNISVNTWCSGGYSFFDASLLLVGGSIESGIDPGTMQCRGICKCQAMLGLLGNTAATNRLEEVAAVSYGEIIPLRSSDIIY